MTGARSVKLDGPGRRLVRLQLSRAARRAVRRALRGERRTIRLKLRTVVIDAADGSRRTLERSGRLVAGRRTARR